MSCIKLPKVQQLTMEKCKSSSKSDVWFLFKNVSGSAECTLCKVVLRHPCGGSTSSLARHLENFHKQDYDRVKMQTKRKLGAFKSLNDLEDNEWKEAKQLLARFVASSNSSLRIVENPWFNDFCRLLNRGYDGITRNGIKAEIENEVERELEKVRLQLSSNSICLSCDLWTSRNGKMSLMAVIGYFVDENFNRIQQVLGLEPLYDRHTSANIDEKLSFTLNKAGLTFGSVSWSVTDGGSNIVKVFGDRNIINSHCGAHLLHLIMENSNEEVMESIYIKGKQISKLLSKSIPLKTQYLETCRLLTLDEAVPRSFSKTRWCGRHILVKTLINHADIFDIVPDLRDFKLSDEERTVCKGYVDLTEQFQEASAYFSSSKSEYAQVIPRIKYLCDFIESHEIFMDSDHLLHDFAINLSNETKRRLSKLEEKLASIVPCVFDPRIFGLDNVLTDSSLWKKACGFLCQHLDEPECESVVATKGKTATDVGSAKNDFWCSIAANATSSKKTRKTMKQLVSDEIRSYKQHVFDARPAQCVSPLQFWRVNQCKYPNLSTLAKKYLAIPGSSAETERIFSSAGVLTANTRRSRLTGSTTEQCLMLLAFCQYETGKAKSVKVCDETYPIYSSDESEDEEDGSGKLAANDQDTNHNDSGNANASGSLGMEGVDS